MDAGHIPCRLKIEVMIYSTFLQLLKQGILFKFPIIAITLISKPTMVAPHGTLALTGTTGTTITTETTGTTDFSTLVIIGTFIALFIIAHLLDREFNQKQNLDQELTSLDRETQD